MKRSWFSLVFLCCFAVSATLAHSGEISWLTYSQALALSAKDGKPVFLELYADWCVPCRQMAATTLKNPTIVQYVNTTFHPVRINVDQQGKMLCQNEVLSVEQCVNEMWEFPGIPAFAAVDSHGFLLKATVGGYTPDDFMKILKQFVGKGSS